MAPVAEEPVAASGSSGAAGPWLSTAESSAPRRVPRRAAVLSAAAQRRVEAQLDAGKPPLREEAAVAASLPTGPRSGASRGSARAPLEREVVVVLLRVGSGSTATAAVMFDGARRSCSLALTCSSLVMVELVLRHVSCGGQVDRHDGRDAGDGP